MNVIYFHQWIFYVFIHTCIHFNKHMHMHLPIQTFKRRLRSNFRRIRQRLWSNVRKSGWFLRFDQRTLFQYAGKKKKKHQILTQCPVERDGGNGGTVTQFSNLSYKPNVVNAICKNLIEMQTDKDKSRWLKWMLDNLNKYLKATKQNPFYCGYCKPFMWMLHPWSIFLYSYWIM